MLSFNLMDVDLIGSVAAVLTTVAFVPQVMHSLKTRDMSGVSLPMYTIFTIGVALWLVYGLMLNNPPLIYSNALTLCCALIILGLKIKQK